MVQSNSQKSDTWKDKVKHYGKIVLIIAIAIWFFNIAQDAQQMAQENKEFVTAPDYEISYVPGGPKRFKSEFKNFRENTDKEIKEDKYLWSTLIIENTGGGAAQQINIKDIAAVPIAYVGYAEPGYGYTTIEVKHEPGDKKAVIDLQSLNIDEDFFVFIAMNPPGIERPYDKAALKQWVENYETYQKKIVVKSEEDKEVLYGDGLAGLYK